MAERERDRAWWQDQPLRAKALVVLSIPLFALSLSSIAFLAVHREESAKTEAILEADQLRADLDMVLALVVDVETGARGYALTRDRAFLEPFFAARARLPETLAAIDRHDHAFPSVAARDASLDALVDLRLAGADALVRAADEGRDLGPILAEGKATTDAVRTEVAAMLGDLDRARVQGEQDAAALRDRSTAIILGALVVGLAGGIGGAVLLARGTARRVGAVLDAVERLAQEKPLGPEVPGEDEIGRLDRGLRSAASLLDAQRAELVEARAMVEDLVRSSPMMLLSGIIRELDEPDALGAEVALDVTYVSRNVERIIGLTPAEFVNSPTTVYERLHPDDRERVIARRVAAYLARPVVLDDEYRLANRSGEYRWLRVSLHERLDGSGRADGYALDVTEENKAREQLADLKEDAERARSVAESANRAKSQFLSRMSHELRTPLNSILGFGQLLEMDSPTPEQQGSVDQILRAGRHLLELINEVLDISRIEAGELTLSLEPVELRTVVHEAVQLIHPSAAGREVTIVEPAPRDDAGYVLADRQRLLQILLNLLSNGVKYNRRGGSIELSVERDEAVVRLAVRDTGRGIAADALGAVFVPFDRLGAERSDIEGTGVGLALSRGLAERMGGTLRVESALGEGSTFTLALPAAEAGAERVEVTPPPVEPEVSTRDITVLSIEDNLANVKLIERVLELREGARLMTAMHGRLGLQLAAEHQPDLVMLDLHLPDMGGEDVLRELRSDPRTQHLEVVIVSADATLGLIQRLKREGADHYLTKPIDVAELLALVDQIRSKETTRP